MILIEPSAEYGPQIRAYRQEFLDSGDSMDGTGGLGEFEDPEEWIAFLARHRDPRTVPEGRVPATQYMLVREGDGKIVGMLDIRHHLNGFLEKYGGHIGYSVAPGERRKGYAAQMLGMAQTLKVMDLLRKAHGGQERRSRHGLRPPIWSIP